jgi:thiamine-monophosphate kinase
MHTSHNPFTAVPEMQIAHLGESALLENIQEWLGTVTPPTPLGMGDDCALLEFDAKQKTCITTDSISYGQHIDASITPFQAGTKLIHRNLSDLAAMGATPHSAVLAILSGPDLACEWLAEFFRGVRESCNRYRLKIVGGDLSTLACGQFSAVLTLTGETKQAVLRHTAQLKDRIYVTGTLGGSLLGKHYLFEPRLAEGQWLAEQSECVAMIDLTDGMGKDLQALLPKDSSVAIDLNKTPLAPAAKTMALKTGYTPKQHAFCDGEDYELLIAVRVEFDEDASNFEARWLEKFPQLELTQIGTIIPKQEAGIFIEATSGATIPWTYGYQHWKRNG